MSTTDNKRINYNTLEALDFVFNNSHRISLANYHNHNIMALDLTSTQEASHDFFHPELTNCTISVELKFNASLGKLWSYFSWEKVHQQFTCLPIEKKAKKTFMN